MLYERRDFFETTRTNELISNLLLSTYKRRSKTHQAKIDRKTGLILFLLYVNETSSNRFAAYLTASIAIELIQTKLFDLFSDHEFEWDRIHSIHQIIRSILRRNINFFPQKWLKNKISPYIQNSLDTRNSKDSSRIYLPFNIFTKDFYVGESSNFKKRIEDEIRTARHCYHNITRKKMVQNSTFHMLRRQWLVLDSSMRKSAK